MHSTRQDADPAASQVSDALPGHVLDVVVLTTDESLLATLREAAGPEHALWRAASADAAVDLLVGGRCGVLIADLSALRGEVVALFERLHAQFPELVLLATGRREDEGAIGSLISNGLIYRFLHKPVSPARAGLFITAATRRYQELRNVEPIALTTVRTIAMRPHMGKIAGVVVVLLGVLTAALLWRTQDRAAPMLMPTAAAPVAATPELTADLTARAQIAFATGRLAAPRGDNALEYYREVLAAQPQHAEARAGVARVLSELDKNVRSALDVRDPGATQAALSVLQRAEPTHPGLGELRAALTELQHVIAQQVSVEPAPQDAVTPVAERDDNAEASVAAQDVVRDGAADVAASAQNGPTADQLAEIARLRERGALIAPPGDNAFESLAALRAAFPEAPELQPHHEALVSALLSQARKHLKERAFDDASAMLARADMLSPGEPAVRALQSELRVEREAQAFYADVVSAASLRRTRESAPVYPREAQRRGVEGWVDVEFTIAADGSTQEFKVLEAAPPGVFEQAALDSVQTWRFAPVIKNGKPSPQRAVLRMRFALR